MSTFPGSPHPSLLESLPVVRYLCISPVSQGRDSAVLCYEQRSEMGAILTLRLRLQAPQPPCRKGVRLRAINCPCQCSIACPLTRSWIERFVTYYNDHHRYFALYFVTASEMHNGDHIEILAPQQALYEQSKMKNPSRWISGMTPNWSPATDTWTIPSGPQREERLARA